MSEQEKRAAYRAGMYTTTMLAGICFWGMLAGLVLWGAVHPAVGGVVLLGSIAGWIRVYFYAGELGEKKAKQVKANE